MANTIEKGITITFRGDTTKFDDAVKTVNKELKGTRDELNILNKELKLDPTNFDKLSQKMDVLKQKEALLNEEIIAYRQEMTKLDPASEAFKQAELKCRDLEVQVKKTSDELKEMGGNKVSLAFNTLGTKLSDAGSSVSDLGKKMSGLSAVATGLLTGFASLSYSTAQMADDINTLSKQTGLSTETLQVFKQMADLIDVDLNSLAKSAQNLVKNLDTKSAQESFKKLGISVKNANGTYKQSEELLFETITALQNVEDESERSIIANDLLGKSYASLGTLINDSTINLDDLTKSAKENGKILSTDELNALNDVNDNIDKMKQILGGMGTKIASEFSDPVKNLTEKMVDLATKVSDFVDKLDTEDKERLLNIIAIVGTVAPLLITVGTTLTSLGTIISTVGTAISTLTSIVKLMNLAFEANPIGVVVALLGTLATAVIYAWNNCDWFREAVIKLWEKISQSEFIQGLINILGKLKEAFIVVKEKVQDLWEKFTQSQFVNNIKDAFVNLKDAVGWVIDKVKELWDKFKDSTFGQNFIDAINDIKDVVDDLKSALSRAWEWLGNVISRVKEFLNSGYQEADAWDRSHTSSSGSTHGGSGGSFRSGGYGSFMSNGYGTLELSTTINVNNNGSQLTQYDAQIFGRQIVDYVNDKLGRRI